MKVECAGDVVTSLPLSSQSSGATLAGRLAHETLGVLCVEQVHCAAKAKIKKRHRQLPSKVSNCHLAIAQKPRRQQPKELPTLK